MEVGWQSRVEIVAKALLTAHEEGRKQGLEEAERVVEGVFDPNMGDLATAIRKLLEEPK
jgi:hypothetical protein